MPSVAREHSSFTVNARSEEHVPLAERDTRLDDYLNDKLQIEPDLKNLASLIANVEIQKKQLEEQVSAEYTLAHLSRVLKIITATKG